MRKIFTLFALATFMFVAKSSADIVEPDANDKAKLTCTIGSSDDLTKIPVIISLENSIEITAVEGNLRLPGGLGPDKVLYSEDDEDFVYDQSARWKKTHALTAFAGTAAHGQDAFFFSIVSSKSASFGETEGAIVTFYFDGSSLTDGVYEADFFDAISVWTDKVTTTTYKMANTKCQFTISNGKATAVGSIEAEAAPAAPKGIYTITGQPVSAPIKGQIYVIDGKTVKY
ncbi:MAG: hypothetical protein PUD79_03685 [Prevotellaceae bacterium]|nr:hypothetical protein [Prevotellaceae bacterium]